MYKKIVFSFLIITCNLAAMDVELTDINGEPPVPISKRNCEISGIELNKENNLNDFSESAKRKGNPIEICHFFRKNVKKEVENSAHSLGTVFFIFPDNQSLGNARVCPFYFGGFAQKSSSYEDATQKTETNEARRVIFNNKKYDSKSALREENFGSKPDTHPFDPPRDFLLNLDCKKER